MEKLLATSIWLAANLLIAIPYGEIRNPIILHLTSIVTSTIGYLLVFELQAYVKIFSLSLFTWLFARPLAKYSNGPLIIFTIMLLSLAHSHYKVQILGPKGGMVDETVPIMTLVIKLSSFAWSVRDGHKHCLTRYQQKYQIKDADYPLLLEFLGYIFYFPGFLLGPSFPFKAYSDYCKRIGDFKSIPKGKFHAALKALLWAAFSLYVMFNASPYVNHQTLLQMTNAHFYKKMFIIYLAGQVCRQQFYAGWKLSEAAAILTGLGYSGPDVPPEDSWNRLENVNILGVELAQSPRDMLIHWNKNTALWLREDVYVRMIDSKISKTFATLLTSLTSAFWHGFHPGYYLTFVLVAFVTYSARLVRKHIRPLFLPRSYFQNYKWLYDLTTFLGSQFIINYTITSFILLRLDESLSVYRSVNYIGHLAVLCIILLLSQRPIILWLNSFTVNASEKTK